MWWRTRRRFEEADLAPLEAIGEQAGVLLRNARLHDALNTRAGRLRTLTRLNQLVSSSLEPDEVLAGIAAAAVELMQVPVVSVWVVDAALKRLDARAFAGPAGVPDFPRRTFDLGEGDVGWVATHRRALEIDDVASDARVTNREWWDAHGFQSFLGVPIVFQDLLLGVLVMGGRAPFRLAADDHEMLDIFVTQSASAIAKARLFQDIQDRRRLTEDLYALTQAMDRSMDLQERVQSSRTRRAARSTSSVSTSGSRRPTAPRSGSSRVPTPGRTFPAWFPCGKSAPSRRCGSRASPSWCRTTGSSPGCRRCRRGGAATRSCAPGASSSSRSSCRAARSGW